MHGSKTYIIDIETDSLEAKVLHLVILKDIVTNEYFEYDASSFSDLVQLLRNDPVLVGHNIINFDLPVLSRHLGVSFNQGNIVDTLVLSHLLYHAINDGHSLDAWGTRLGHPKTSVESFEYCTAQLRSYCRNDVDLNHKLYLFLIDKLKPMGSKPIEVEHKIAFICRDMHDNGFTFNSEEATKLLEEITKEIESLDVDIQKAFPPVLKPIRVITPTLTKTGTLHLKDFRWYKGTDFTIFQEGCPFTLVDYEPFNPGSTKQIIDRIGKWWGPVDKTDGHIEAERNRDKVKLERARIYGWKISENNLATLSESAPAAARQLVRRILLSTRQRTLADWIQLSLEDGKIHGNFNGIGTWTHRMSHTEPNMGNVSANKSIKYTSEELNALATSLGGRMRGLFKASPGMVLVGTDAEGIQLRIFAHLIDDPTFAQSLIHGKKEDGTDPHSINQRILQANSRDDAKTFIYAFLLGAGVAKVQSILKKTKQEASKARDSFIVAYPGLKKLKEEVIPLDAERGYFTGLDGRYVVCSSEHLMLAGYLQNAEACIMKHANILWRERLNDLGIPFRQVNFVHDEWQTECLQEHAELVAQVQRQSIVDTGITLKVRCPLAGSSNIGLTWYDTH